MVVLLCWTAVLLEPGADRKRWRRRSVPVRSAAPPACVSKAVPRRVRRIQAWSGWPWAEGPGHCPWTRTRQCPAR